MTTPAPQTSNIDEIVKQLKAAGVVNCDECALSEPEDSLLHKPLVLLLSNKVSRGFVSSGTSNIRLLVDNHFDISVDVFIKDSELASLGLVHLVPQRFKDQSFEKWCRQRID